MKIYLAAFLLLLFCETDSYSQYVYKGVDLFSFTQQEGFTPCKNNADEFCRDSVDIYRKVVIIPASEKIVFTCDNTEVIKVVIYRELANLFGREPDVSTPDYFIWDFKDINRRISVDAMPGNITLYSIKLKP